MRALLLALFLITSQGALQHATAQGISEKDFMLQSELYAPTVTKDKTTVVGPLLHASDGKSVDDPTAAHISWYVAASIVHDGKVDPDQEKMRKKLEESTLFTVDVYIHAPAQLYTHIPRGTVVAGVTPVSPRAGKGGEYIYSSLHHLRGGWMLVHFSFAVANTNFTDDVTITLPLKRHDGTQLSLTVPKEQFLLVQKIMKKMYLPYIWSLYKGSAN